MKDHQRRWRCPCCKSEGWNKHGTVPTDHARADGRACRAYRVRQPAAETRAANGQTIMELGEKR